MRRVDALDGLRTVGAIARHEVALRLRDRSAIVLCFVAPTVLGLLLHATIGALDASLDRPVSIAVAADGEAAAALADHVRDLDERITVDVAASGAAARRSVADGAVDAAVVVVDGRVEVVQGRQHPFAIDVALRIGELAAALPDPADVAGLRQGVVRAETDLGPADLTMQAYVFPGMAVAFSFISVGYGAKGVWTARHDGLLGRMLTAVGSRRRTLAGVWAALVALAATGMTTLWFVSSTVLGASWGPLVGVAAVVLASSLAAASLALAVALLARSESQVDAVSAAAGIVLGLLGAPIVALRLPAAVDAAAHLLPSTWAAEAFAELAAGAGPASVAAPVVMIVAVAGAALGLSSRAVRRGALG